MTSTPERRDELVAAAAADDLTAEERAELDALRAGDPAVDREIAELRALLGRVRDAVPEWDDSAPDTGLRDRVVAIGTDAEGGTTGANAAATARVSALRPRRGWLLPVVAAACLAVGLGIGALALPLLGGPAAPVAEEQPGAPGLLGALEAVDFAGEPAGVRVDGAVVAHTWGTETILEIDGLAEGARYEVVVVDEAGIPHSSGSFTGSAVPVDCRMNTATLRPDATRVEILDATGGTVATAVLPAVAT
jgi:hypothetical protein